MMTFLDTAYCLAVEAHMGQTRRDGVTPYIKHIDAVLSRMSKDSSDIDMAVAAAHDIWEDTNMSLSEIREAFLKDHPDRAEDVAEIINGIVTLSKSLDESYSSFINRIYDHRNGRWVHIKIADILANLSDSPTPKQIRKYAAALMLLTEERG